MEGNYFDNMKKNYQSNSVDSSEENYFDKLKKSQNPDNPSTFLDTAKKVFDTTGIGAPIKIAQSLIPDDSTINRIKNRIKNIVDIVQTGNKYAMGMDLTPAQDSLINTLKEATTTGIISRLRVASDFLPGQEQRAIANVDIKQSVTDIFSNVKNTLHSAGSGDVGSVVQIPINMVTSIVGDAFVATTALDINGKTVKAVAPEQVDQAVRSTIGNVVAAVVAPAAEEMMAARSVKPIAEALGTTDLSAKGMMSADLGGVAKAATLKPTLGKIGQAILNDVTAAGAAGAAQGAVAKEGTPEMLSSAATGLLYAPIGVLTGWYRGVEAPMSAFEHATTQAYTVKNLRLWQNVADANVESLVKRVSDLLSADKIDDVLAKDPSQYNQKIGTLKVPIEDSPLVKQVLIQKGLSPSVSDLYQTFKKTLTEDKSFETSLAEFATKYDLNEHLPELRENFAKNYMAEDPTHAEFIRSSGVIAAQKRTLAGKFDGSALLDEADKRGFYFTNEFGQIKVRDVESGETLGTAYNTKEAMEIMQIMGDHPNPIAGDAGANLPTPNGNGIKPPISQLHLQGWEPEHIDQHLGSRLNQWFSVKDRQWNVVSSMNARVEAFDRVNHSVDPTETVNTDFKTNVFKPLEQAHRETMYNTKQSLSHPLVKIYDAFARSVEKKFGTAGLEQAGHILEADSYENMIKPSGYSKGFTISQDAQDLAQFAHKENVDLTKIGNYRRAVIGAKSEATQRAYLTAQKNVQLGAIDPGVALNTEVGAVEKQPQFVTAMDRINRLYKPDAAFMKAHDMIDALYKKADGSAHLAGATRLKLALDDPNHFGLTQQDFVKQHNVAPEVVELATKTKELFDHFGKQFGVPDSRMLMRYMNHYRQFGDMLDTNFITDFESGIMDPTMRQFASSMIRTGEVVNYSMNPVSNLYSYIRGGTKAQYLYPVLNDLKRVDGGAISVELAKISNPKNKAQIVKWLDDYQRDITGQISLSDKDWENIRVEHLKSLKDGTGAGMTSAEIIKEMQQPDAIDTIMALSSSGLLGGRLSLAARDNIDLAQKFFTKHGTERLWQLYRTKVNPVKIAELERQGFIINPEGADVYNITHGQLNSYARDISNVGFKMSLQSYYYLKNQAAVWEHTMKYTSDVLNDLNKGVIQSKKAAYKKLFLNGYDAGSQKEFNAYVTDGNISAAARVLAKEEVREMVGYFTKGNQAPILNSKPGRLFGQLGSWSMTNRSALQNILTRGTKEEMRTRLLRYGIANGALMAAGSAAGVNLGRWMLLPTSVLNAGGPVLSSIQAISGFASSNFGGSAAQSNFTNRALLTAAKQFVPFSYAASDIMKASDLAQHGSGYGPVRIGLQALGVQNNLEDGTWLDYINNTQPIHWSDPTPFNANPFSKSQGLNLNPFDDY